MSKIPTAEEFFESWCTKKRYTSIDQCDDIEECMIEFAKLHVEAALKEASEKTYKASTRNGNVYHTENAKDSIINAYPLSKIQ